MLALVHSTLMTFVENDLKIVTNLTSFEVDVMQTAMRTSALYISIQASLPTPTVSLLQLKSFKTTLNSIERLIATLSPIVTPLPYYSYHKEQLLSNICDWPLFDRFRRGEDVEKLAGEAPLPPIIRPIELTLVPERVYTIYEAIGAMKHAVDLCVLLANQRKHIRNSCTLRVCLISHLFTRVIPLPLPITHPDRRKRCFWASQDVRSDTQIDILRILNLLSRHFATASLSVKTTRSGDAIRILTFSCMATVFDAILRKQAIDLPSQVSLHYAGRAPGPGLPFGFQLGNFAEESEYLKFSNPETTTARTQVLDYFYELKSIVDDSHMLFTYELQNQFNQADHMFIDQICIQMGYEKGMTNTYLTGTDSVLLVSIYILCIFILYIYTHVHNMYTI